MGGLPACATKLVKPDAVPSSQPSQRGGGGASARGGQRRRMARKIKVMAPTTPATVLPESRPKSSAPMTTPSRPAGISRRSKARSQCLIKAMRPRPSMSSSTGSKIAAACGTGTTRAIKGTASAPKPAPKPLFEMPIKITAGTATA